MSILAKTKNIGILLVLMLAALAHLPSTHGGTRVAYAKPTTPPTATPVPLDGGMIYHFEVGTTPRMHEIAPNGTGDRVLTGVTQGILTLPSRVTHNGKRWFVEVREVGGGAAFFPDGGKLHDLFAYYEGSAGAVQLTNNGGVCVSMQAGDIYANWAPSASGQVDGAVAWVGKRWADAGNGGSPCDTLAETGIYRAALTFDGSGDVTGIASQPASPEVLAPNPESFTWRPNGQQVAYTTNQQLFLSPDPTNLSPLNGGKQARWPDWSPTGGKIAFHGATSTGSTGVSAIFSINPDNTGLALLAQGRNAKNSSQTSLILRLVRWSPNGSHLVYTEVESSSSSYFDRVRRMQASGSNNVVLSTSGGPNGSFALGWGAP